jgi:hypothetical protein
MGWFPTAGSSRISDGGTRGPSAWRADVGAIPPAGGEPVLWVVVLWVLVLWVLMLCGPVPCALGARVAAAWIETPTGAPAAGAGGGRRVASPSENISRALAETSWIQDPGTLDGS